MTEAHLRYDLHKIVGWGDCDAAGISYYAKHFDWFTEARFQLLESFGLPYMETFHHNDVVLVCLKAESDYKKMLRPLEKIKIHTLMTTRTRTRMVFEYEIIKENGDLAGKGFTMHAYVNSAGRPLNLQKSNRGLWERLEKGFEFNGNQF